MNNNLMVYEGSLLEVSQRKGTSLAIAFLDCDAVVVIDQSGSMSACDALDGVSRYDAADLELKRLQREYPGRLAVVDFSDEAQFCPGGVPTRHGGSTALHKALRFVQFMDNVGISIIVVSDGQPDDERQALKIAAEFKTHIDCIFIGPENDVYGGREFLRKLAETSGGRFAVAKSPGLLGESVQRFMLTGG